VAVQSAADQVAAELGGADLLFDNAGVMLFNPAEAPAVGSWQREIDINVKGLTNVIATFTPQLVRAAAERGVADLINTSSVAAQSVLPAFAVYTGTKAYVSHLSRNLRAELGTKKVRVSVIELGLVDTELQNHVGSDEVRAALESAKQLLEWLTPQDIAETVGFVASLPPRVNLPHITAMPTGSPPDRPRDRPAVVAGCRPLRVAARDIGSGRVREQGAGPVGVGCDEDPVRGDQGHRRVVLGVDRARHEDLAVLGARDAGVGP
jgi:NADP-dependent 3-hydroxy acid dehydrogenase YdfG